MEVNLSATKTVTEKSSGEFIAINSSILAGLKHGSAACLLASAPLNSTIFRRHCSKINSRLFERLKVYCF